MTQYSVKYPNANLEMSQYQDSPQASLIILFNSKEQAQNFAQETLVSLKDNFTKVLDDNAAKLINKTSGQEVICDNECNITIYKMTCDNETCEGLVTPDCHVDNNMLGATFLSYLEDTISF